MSNKPTYKLIADQAKCLYTGYQSAAEDYRHDPSASNQRAVEAFTIMLHRLAAAVAEQFPKLWPELRHVSQRALWHVIPSFDWDAARSELRRIEAAALAGDNRMGKDDRALSPQHAKLSPRDLAEKHNVNYDALRKRLDRWRYEHDSGYVEVSNPAKNEPKYLFDESAVLPVIEELREKSVGRFRPANVQAKKI